jgi:hypothetical protein
MSQFHAHEERGSEGHNWTFFSEGLILRVLLRVLSFHFQSFPTRIANLGQSH